MNLKFSLSEEAALFHSDTWPLHNNGVHYIALKLDKMHNPFFVYLKITRLVRAVVYCIIQVDFLICLVSLGANSGRVAEKDYTFDILYSFLVD